MNSLDFGGTAHLIYEYGYFKDKKISVGCGGSLANTLFWLNFFKNKVLIRGILGDDNLGKILNEEYLKFSNKEIIVQKGAKSAGLHYYIDKKGNIIKVNFNYGITNRVEKLSVFPTNCRVNIIGGFELENAKQIKQKDNLCSFNGDTIVLNLGGLTDVQKFYWFLKRANNFKNLIIVGNNKEVKNLSNKNITHHNYILIITQGNKGAELFYKKDHILYSGVTKSRKKIIDTIGAGDGLLAMFLDQWYKSNQTFYLKDLKKILKKAVNFGTLISTYYGARPHLSVSDLFIYPTCPS